METASIIKRSTAYPVRSPAEVVDCMVLRKNSMQPSSCIWGADLHLPSLPVSTGAGTLGTRGGGTCPSTLGNG